MPAHAAQPRTSPSELDAPDVHTVLRERFGHSAFRPGQQQIIRALLAERDVLAVLPTGGGKSLVYQLTSQLLPGLTVVVSPLLALMKDQVESLEEHGVEVGVVNSAQSERESKEDLREVRRGEAKLLYVTPERFDDDEFMDQIRRVRVSLLVVDEAHCVSEWGPSFRPAYLTLGGVVERLGRPTLLALTATATPWVRRDVVDRLRMREPAVVVRGFDRPNLFFEVRRVESEPEEHRLLRELLTGEVGAAAREGGGGGIVYTQTTRAAQETAEWMTEWGFRADYYHGQRKKADRARVQEAFMAGELDAIAATNAFGMGVDKPDVRFVVHRDIPASLEAYYQEAGRAGRDGEPAHCALIYRPNDLGRAAFLAGTRQLTREDVVRAREALRARPAGSLRELSEASGLSRGDLARLVVLLSRHGLVEERRGRVRLLAADFDPDAVSLETEEHRRAYERSRLEMMRGYAELRECRRQYILNYFGEELDAERCDRCDNDLDAGHAAEDTNGQGERAAERGECAPTASPFAINDRVVHKSWGEGTVQRVTDDAITVLFDTVGYKMLATDIVLEKGSLARATG